MSVSFFLPLVAVLHLHAEHEVAEGAVDVLAAALHGRVVGRVHGVDRQLSAAACAVQGVHLDVAGAELAGGGRGGRGRVAAALLRHLRPHAAAAAAAAAVLLVLLVLLVVLRLLVVASLGVVVCLLWVPASGSSRAAAGTRGGLVGSPLQKRMKNTCYIPPYRVDGGNRMGFFGVTSSKVHFCTAGKVKWMCCSRPFAEGTKMACNKIFVSLLTCESQSFAHQQ